jgi:hypothetical protein
MTCTTAHRTTGHSSSRDRRALLATVLAAGLLMGLVACDAAPDGGAVGSRSPTADTAAPPPSPLPTGSQPVTLDPARFSADVTHPYWPLQPGTRWTYREVDLDGSVADIVVIATGATKRIADGVTARVVRDTVREDGEIVEDTLDWYAQDSDGNVWYLGEQTAEFDGGAITSRSGSFEAGVDGALPGILLPAEPRPGERYRQEYYRGQAEDNGEVLATGQLAQTPTGTYRDALLTRDTATIEPDAAEYKLYARGVGLVLAFDVSGGDARETLVKVDRVDPSTGTGPLGTP